MRSSIAGASEPTAGSGEGREGLWRALLSGCPRAALSSFALASVALALSGGAYGLLVGPLLRLAFGGEAPAWPPPLRPHLPPPPSADDVRAWLPWLIALTALCKGAAQLTQRVSLAALSAGFGRLVRARLAWALLSAPLDAREKVGEAHLHALLTGHVERLERWVEDGVAPLWRDGAQVLTLALTSYLVSGELGLLVLGLYPLLFAPVALVGARLRRAARAELSSAAALSRWALAHVRATSWLRVHGLRAEARAVERAQHALLWRAQRRLAALRGLAPSFTELGGALVIAGSMGFFLRGVEEGRWRAEELMSLFVCLVLMYQPLKGLTRAQSLWAGAWAAWEELAPWLARGEERAGERAGEKAAPPLASLPLAVELLSWRVERGGQLVALLPSAELRAGRVTRVTGPNGAGKSSLLYQLTGLNPPPRGGALRVVVGGGEERPPGQGALRAAGGALLQGECAWLAQGLADPLELLSLGELSVSRVFELLPLAPLARPWPLSAPRVFEALGLPQEWLTPSGAPALEELSGGERRKLSLALALCAGRPLLLLDEPEAHLDASSIEGLCGLLRALEEEEACVLLLVTHDPRLAALAGAELHLEGAL